MGDLRNDGLRQFQPNNQYFNVNPNVNIPPPPLPPRFPPPMPPVPVLPPIPPPACPSFPFPAQQLFPPPSGRPVFIRATWDRNRPTPPPPSNVVNQQPFIENQPSLENPQDWVDEWVKNKRNSKAIKSDIKIHEVKGKIDAAFKLVRELENSSRTLGVMVKTVSSKEWQQKCDEVEEKKAKLECLLNEIKLMGADFNSLKEKISKRAKKRARLRRQSERLKKQKEKKKLEEQNLNFRIDNWLREMQDEVERVKREEELKKEADAVLWGVTKKKTEAKRQVAMLSALLTLRSARVARLTAAGLPVSQTQIATFNTVIERLKAMWSRYLSECQLEEQALRGMLGAHRGTGDAATDAVKTHRRLVLGEWEAAVFGSSATQEPAPTTDQLVEIRRAWDRFAVAAPSLLASAVPPGYVLPVPPSSDLWQSFLKY